MTRNLISLLEIDVDDLELTFNHYERVFDELICIDLGKGYNTAVMDSLEILGNQPEQKRVCEGSCRL